MNKDMNKISREDLIRTLGSLPETRMPGDISQEVMDGLERRERTFLKSVHTVFYPAFAACAAVLIIVGVLVFQHQSRTADAEKLFADGVRLLSRGQYAKALAEFESASQKNPDDADIMFHLGVANGKLSRFREEKAAYLKTIQLSPDHSQAHFFLGHSYMSEKAWAKASTAYDRALTIDPGLNTALFNKGLALKQAGQVDQAHIAWKMYLETRTTGRWARRAVAHLNAGGDFTYRAFQIGRQQMVLGPFLSGDDYEIPDIEEASLKLLAGSLRDADDMDLFVTVYIDNRPKAAKRQANAIKEKLIRCFPDINSDRIRLSWFGQEDRVALGHGQFTLEKSIRFLGMNRNIIKGVNS